jgi:transcriptional regulator with XRE-family HTH domain
LWIDGFPSLGRGEEQPPDRGLLRRRRRPPDKPSPRRAAAPALPSRNGELNLATCTPASSPPAAETDRSLSATEQGSRVDVVPDGGLTVKPPVPGPTAPARVLSHAGEGATSASMARAKDQDYPAQIRAIRLALGAAEGLKYKDGRPRAIRQADFAERIGRHVSAVKKWELGEQEPDKDSIVAINEIAPPALRIRLDTTLALVTPEPEESPDSLTGALDSALLGYVRGPGGRELSKEEWEQLRALLLATAKP